MRFAQTAAVIACLALGACASTRAPDTRLPATFEATQAGGLAPEALDRWWTAFNDPELERLIDTALTSSPDARTAASRLEEARATRRGALATLWPQGNITGSTRKTETRQIAGEVIDIPGFSNTGESQADQANFNVSWEIDLFGRTFAARRAANGDRAAARFAYEGARASLAASIADAYFEARGLAIQLEDARETARIRRELMRVATRRVERGLAAGSDSDLVASDLAQAESQAAGLEAELQAARRSLLILVGRGIEPTSSLPVDASVGEAPPVPTAVPSELLARRPDVREALARIASASGRKNIAQLAFLPKFTLTPGLGWSRSEQPGFSSTTENWSIGVGLVQPVLEIPRLMAELEVQNQRTEQAVIAYEKAIQTAFGETENTLVRLDADRRRVALLRDGSMRGRRSYEAARTRYDLGIDSLQDTMSAEQSWRVIRSQYAAAQVQALRRTVQAYKALGGGWNAAAIPTNAQAR